MDYHLPTEDAKNQVEDKERAKQNQRHKVNPWPFVANSIINLKENTSCALLLNPYVSRTYDYSKDVELKKKKILMKCLHLPSREH